MTDNTIRVYATQGSYIPVWISAHKDLSGNDVRLFAYLAACGIEGHSLSRGQMAEAMRTSERSITRSLKALREAGAIHVVSTPGYANAYILWPGPGPEGVDTSVQGVWTPVSTLDTSVQGQDPENDATLYSLNNECTFEKSTENFPAESSGQKYQKNVYTDDFNAMWKLYPRKTNKPGAYRKYLTTLNNGVDHSTLLDAVIAYAASRDGQDDRYTLHGATFFGPDERWRDFADVQVDDPALDKYEQLCAVIYDSYDADGVWINPDTGETCSQNPLIGGYKRPRGSDNYFVAADGTPYDLNSSGERVATGYWNGS